MWIRTVLLFSCLHVIARITTASHKIDYDDEFLGLYPENSKDCKSTYLKSRMCHTISDRYGPCEKFEVYACGKYSQEKLSRSNPQYYYYSMLEDSRNLMKKRLINLIKLYSNQTLQTNETAINLGVDLFNSCMNRSLQPMKDMLNKYGGWPAINSDYEYEHSIDLNKALGILNERLNIAPIVSMSYSASSKIFTLGLPTLIVEKDFFLYNSMSYWSLMSTTAWILGDNYYVPKQIDDAYVFQVEILNIYTESDEFIMRAIPEMEMEFPGLMRIVRYFLEPYGNDTLIRLESVTFLSNLDLMLRNTSNLTIVNHIMFQSVYSMGEYLTEELYEKCTRFLEKMLFKRAIYPEKMDEETCLKYVYEYLPMATEKMYLINEDNEVRDKKKVIGTEIAINIQNAFVEMVRDATWMDLTTKEIIMKKLQKIKFIFGDMPGLDVQLERLSKFELILHSDNFLRNILRLREFRESYTQAQPPASAWDVKATYKGNIVYIPDGILQWPYFMIDAPLFFNYGALGFVIGHEIGHAIDPSRRSIDKNRVHFNWEFITENQYYEKIGCFERQYSAMRTDTGIKLNGSNTLNENIADNLGMRAAYKAFHNLTIPNDQLVGLWNMSYQEMFWISMGQSQCVVMDESLYERRIQKSTHTDFPHRVTGMIENMRDVFMKDFKCSKNSPIRTITTEQCVLF